MNEQEILQGQLMPDTRISPSTILDSGDQMQRGRAGSYISEPLPQRLQFDKSFGVVIE
jgi:hypothetical protein